MLQFTPGEGAGSLGPAGEETHSVAAWPVYALVLVLAAMLIGFAGCFTTAWP